MGIAVFSMGDCCVIPLFPPNTSEPITDANFVSSVRSKASFLVETDEESNGGSRVEIFNIKEVGKNWSRKLPLGNGNEIDQLVSCISTRTNNAIVVLL